MAKTSEKTKAFEPKTVAEKMAFEPYMVILLRENPNPKEKWGSQFVGINEYKQFLPREEEIVVAQSILNTLNNAAESASEYTDVEGNRQATYRDDLNIIPKSAMTAEQAHALRLDPKAKMRVFPEKLPATALEHIEKEGF